MYAMKEDGRELIEAVEKMEDKKWTAWRRFWFVLLVRRNLQCQTEMRFCRRQVYDLKEALMQPRRASQI